MNIGSKTCRSCGVSRAIGVIRSAAFALTAAFFAGSAHAAFHLWVIQELFTNLDGTQQFIELFTPSFGQGSTASTQIQVKDQAGTTTHTFTIPTNIAGDTTNHTFLIATAGLQLAGGPAPDFIMPNNFLFAAGGTVTYRFTFQGDVPYTALPVDGITSHIVPGNTNQVNSPKNFSNQTGSVPEPSTWGALGLGGMGFFFLLRRRTA